MLQIRFSNRFEHLQDALLDAMAAPPESPFATEEIIVPSVAIQRRIELAAAERFGICSNVRFSFFAQWLWRQIGHVVKVSESSPFATPVLTWRVLGIFDEPAFIAGYPRLAGYLRHADGVMRYDLAARSASLLDNYLTYRPAWLAAWLDGKTAGIGGLDAAGKEDERWQAALWRRIASDLDTDSRHPSVAFFDAMRAMGPDAPARAGLPAVAHLVCLPTTPPLYLDILNRLAQWIDLRLYVLNPCREYWFDIVDPKRLSWLATRDRDLHHEVGNRLLAAWGGQTRAFIDLLLQDAGAAVVDDADFAPVAGTTLLAQLQRAILDMTELGRGSVDHAGDDRSVEVHVCHSLAREIEVLQDQLLAIFAGPHPPRPSDILVVTPDLEAAAPLIDAVFGCAPKSREIPYAITGRPASAFNPCAQALLEVLALATSRFQASAVFELLQQPIVARRFEVDPAELVAIHAWIGESGIRWGIDARHRGELGLPAEGHNSFGDGLDRLFLGYSLPEFAGAPLNGRIAAGSPEGSAALALGSLREFIRQLEHLHRELAHPKSPDDWRQTLLGVIDSFTAPAGDEIDDQRETAAAIHELHANLGLGGMRRPLEVDIVLVALKLLLDDPTRGGIPGGAVTFASMSSLRNLPYRYVCVLGMNDGAFPTAPHAGEFDLMARDPRKGDRQRRVDERNVFLDLLLAARERFYLSYTGRSVRDNSPLPPSVLIAELLDYCAAAIDGVQSSPESLEFARKRLTVVHPLQSFSMEYFQADADPRRRSFNDEYCEALKARLAMLVEPPAPPAPVAGAAGLADAQAAAADETDDEDDDREAREAFFPLPLAKAGPEFHEVTLDDFQSFFRNPCRCLLRKRLCIALPRGDEELQDDEPFVPDRWARDGLARRVLPRLLGGATLAEVRELARAGIEYPPGGLGGPELDQELQRLGGFARTLMPALAEPCVDSGPATLEFTIDGETWRLSGALGDLRRTGLVRYRYDDARAGDYLAGWIEHLFVNATATPGVIPQTTWYSRDGHYTLRPVDDAPEGLEALLALYREGLRRPIHFFPKAAWKYASEGKSLSKAAGAWQATLHRPHGEARDPAYQLALRGVDDPLDAEFVACALSVYQPLIDAITDDRLEARA